MNKNKLLEDKVLKKYIHGLREHFGGRLKNILLFGSRARGDYSPESDYACILLFETARSNDQKLIDKLESDILLEDYALVSSFPITLQEFKIKQYEPFLMNAKKEGVLL